MSARTYNLIYDRLVEDQDDILGIIAYSYYKRQKIEFSKNFNAQHGREPTSQDMDVFHGLSNNDSAIEGYRVKASALARNFLDEALRERALEIEAQTAAALEARVMALKPRFWIGVAQGIVASVIFVLFLGGIVFISWSARLGITNAVEAAFDIRISPVNPPQR